MDEALSFAAGSIDRSALGALVQELKRTRYRN
jgi:hypothetical protein